ncbi:MAG: ABC transporter permease [Spirochaetia bacterium]
MKGSLLPFYRNNRAILLSYACALLIFVLITLISPGFAGPRHIRILLIDAAIIGVIALGQTFVIITGGIDISIPWTVNCAAVFLTLLSGSHDAHLWLIVPILLAGTTFIGLLNGLGIAYLDIPPIIMTLGMNSILLGGLLGITGGRPGGQAPALVQQAANGNLGPFPVIVIIWLLLIAAATIVLRKTAFGRQLYFIGNNETVALFSGVNVRFTKMLVYCLSGLTAGLGGILLAGRIGQSYLGMGDPYLFQSVIVVVIGGASVLGGSGQYIGTVAGAFILTIINGLLPVFNIPTSAQQIVYGFVLFFAVLLTSVL